MRKGNIIFLNGVSSAGKSTLAKKLQQKSPDSYFCIAQDTFTHILAPCFKGKFIGDKLNELWFKAISAMHHTIKLYSDLGYNVIVDHVLTSFCDEDGKADNSLEECVSLLYDYPILFVKVECSTDELRQREIARGDRAPGTAEWQLQYLVPKDTYDVSVDTSVHSIDKCAEIILDLAKGNNFRAFKELHSSLGAV